MKETLITCLLFLTLVLRGYDGTVVESPLPTPTPAPTPTATPTATPTPTPTATPTATPIPLPLEGMVKGVAGSYYCQYLIGDYYYNWSPMPWVECEQTFVPMIRDAEQLDKLVSGEWELTADLPLILGFNEPDLCPDQACLTPAEAVPLERQRLERYPGYSHVSPAPSQWRISWLSEMRALYIIEYGEPPGWDYLACHCYGSGCGATVAQYVQWADEWDIPGGVLVTEFASFAYGGDYAPAVQEADQLVEWMKGQPGVAGFFWFTASDLGCWPDYVSTYLYDDGTMTPFGEWYQEK